MSMNNISSLMGKKDRIYVSISASVGMELFQVDDNSGHITKYASKHINYDTSSKEITDLEQFREVFMELTTELGIKVKGADVVLNLPTVLLGTRELPSMIEDADIGRSILGEIENSYIFGSHTPVFDWQDFGTSKNAGMRNIFYCALQDSIVSKISDLLKEVGAKVVDIETSCTTILNGLVRAHMVEQYMQPEKIWNLMIVNDGGYSIFSLSCDKIIDFVQEDMPLGEDSGDVYATIASTAELTLLGLPANSLVVVSESDLISAEELANSLTASGSLMYQEISFIDDNLYRRDEFLPIAPTVDPKYKLKPSLKTIGMLQGPKYFTLIKFDFLKVAPKINRDNEIVRFNIGDNIFEITPNSAKLYSIIFAGIILVVLVALYIIVPSLNKPLNDRIGSLEEEISKIEKEITALNAEKTDNKFNAQEEIKNVLLFNRTKLISYITMGEVIPRKLWITYYKVHSKDKIIITGVSASIDDIQSFYKNINNTLPNSKLQLKNMEMSNDSGQDAAVAEAKYYNFIITNDENYPPKTENIDANDNKKGTKSKSKKK